MKKYKVRDYSPLWWAEVIVCATFGVLGIWGWVCLLASIPV